MGIRMLLASILVCSASFPVRTHGHPSVLCVPGLQRALGSRIQPLRTGAVLALRGGGDAEAAAQESPQAAPEGSEDDHILALDIGTFSTVAAFKTRGGGSATLVQNDMSLLETPTAVAFRGRKVEVGEVAADTPATNAANQISTYLPLLGPIKEGGGGAGAGSHLFKVTEGASGTAAAEVAFDGGVLKVPLEQAVALQVSTMDAYCKAQRGSGGDAKGDARCSHVAVGIPPGFSERQSEALRDAVAISGVCDEGETLLVPWHIGLAQAYAERHKRDLMAEANATAPRTVLIVDIGHSSAAALVASFEGLEATVLAHAAAPMCGAGTVDGVLASHFTPVLEGKHGEGVCGAPKSRFRLRKACEMLKKVLSTLDESQVGVDGLLAEAEAAIKLSRNHMNDLEGCRAMAGQLGDLVSGVMGEAGMTSAGGGGQASVEVVGGGSRIPFMVAAVQAAAGGDGTVGRTLDSANALCMGVSIAAAWRLGFLRSEDAGSGVRVMGWEAGGGGGGMGVELLDKVKGEHERLGEIQRELKEQEAAVNALEAYIAEIRSAMGRKHGSKMSQEATNKMLDEAEEWCWGAPAEGGYQTQELNDRLAALKGQVEEANQAFFEAERKDHEETQAALEREAVERRKEEEERVKSGEADDHDSRKLKFEDRMRMAEANKKEGKELFQDGNFAHAAERYLKALGHCSKMFDVTAEQKQQVDPLKEACFLNLAQCWFKLDKMVKCVDNCNECLAINPFNSKALLRRGLAYEKEKKYEEALADAVKVVNQAEGEGEGGNAVAIGLRDRCAETIKTQKAAQKKMYGKMFG